MKKIRRGKFKNKKYLKNKGEVTTNNKCPYKVSAFPH